MFGNVTTLARGVARDRQRQGQKHAVHMSQACCLGSAQSFRFKTRAVAFHSFVRCRASLEQIISLSLSLSLSLSRSLCLSLSLSPSLSSHTSRRFLCEIGPRRSPKWISPLKRLEWTSLQVLTARLPTGLKDAWPSHPAKKPPLGPHSRAMLGALRWSWGGAGGSYEQGTPCRARVSTLRTLLPFPDGTCLEANL